jgi:gliding motility-associated-like protein
VEFGTLGPVCQEQTSFLVTTAKELSGVSGAAVFTGYGISDKGEFNPALTGPGVYQLKYTYTSDNGCSAWKAQTIKVNPQPTVDAGPRKTIMKGSDILLEGSGGGRGVSYEWAPIDFMDDPHIRSPKVAPVSDITYTLKVTSEDGCTNEDSVKVTVLNGIYVPTAFTPNGDGLNDLWRLPRLDSYPETEVWVFDRWGKPVYHSKGREISWNGTANGQTLPAGTFVYYIELKPSGPKLKGTVTLIR